MEFLAINRPTPTATRHLLDAVVPDHVRWVGEQLRAGALIRAGRWGTGGMYIINARDHVAADRVLGEDPLVSAGLVSVEMAAIEPPAPAAALRDPNHATAHRSGPAEATATSRATAPHPSGRATGGPSESDRRRGAGPVAHVVGPHPGTRTSEPDAPQLPDEGPVELLPHPGRERRPA